MASIAAGDIIRPTLKQHWFIMYSVKTQIFQVDSQNPQPQTIALAGKIIRGGGLVAFPTETVYGLGANALDPEAVARIYEVKKRPSHDPLIVHICSLSQLDLVANGAPPLAKRLAETFFPGPLTMVLKRSAQVAPNVSAGLETVAVRMPAHKIPLALIESSGVPIAAPSANLFSRPSPTSAQHVLDDLSGHVDVILDGGSCPIGLESTVIDLTSETPVILRPGGAPMELLIQHVPNLQLSQRYLEAQDGLAMPAPGMLSKHYSPAAKFLVLKGSSQNASQRAREAVAALISLGYKIGLMLTDEDADNFSGLNARLVKLGSENNLEEIARNLFAQMRALEKMDIDLMLMRAVNPQGIGFAIWDRLLRASEQQVYDLDDPQAVDLLLESVKTAKP